MREPFCGKVLGDADHKKFEDIRRRAPLQPLLVVVDQHGLSGLSDAEARQSRDAVI